MSERRACRLVGQWRATQRYRPIEQTDEDALTEGAGEREENGLTAVTAGEQTSTR
jgi:hypothetical protein